jgi:hypothetical protein
MRARKYPWPGTVLENSTEAVDLLCECQDLFRKLRPQIERVANGQKRKRMPAEAYTLWDRLGSMGVNIRRVHEDLYKAEQASATKLGALAELPFEKAPDLSGALMDLSDFKTGRLPYSHWVTARKACLVGPLDDSKRKIIADAISSLERYGRVLGKSAEMVTLAKIEWPNNPDWYLEKIEDLRQLRRNMELLAEKMSTPEPSWNGQGVTIKYSRPELGPFAGDTQ